MMIESWHRKKATALGFASGILAGLVAVTPAAGGTGTLWSQLGVQTLAVIVAIVYAAVMTYLLIIVLNRLIRFKSSEEEEMAGLDRSYHGERGGTAI